jgi:hypothetical protein
MVSACAVSVSAYADQDAINASGYADAVEVLTTLGVIAGDGTNFNPNDTLTRAAAAKIAAALTTGSAGKKIEWTSATSSFVDVDPAHWGNAYINYASQRGYMDGIGDGKFAPDATLTIAEAIVLSVKVAGLRSEVAEMEELLGKPAYWAAYWIAVAGGDYEPAEGKEAIDLIGDLTVFDYTAPCSRAMFAQIAYNMLNNVDKISDGFGLKKAKVMINYATDKVVNVTDTATVNNMGTFDLDLEACIAKAAAAGVADADFGALADTIITITYNEKDTSELYGIAFDSSAKVFTYADAKIANVTYKVGNNNKNDKYITVDGVKYVVAAAGEEVGVGAIGSASSKVPAIAVTVVDANASDKAYIATEWSVAATDTENRLPSIPTYYKAVAYEDNGDGKYDRLVINKYEIALINYDSDPSANKAPDGVSVDTIDFVGATTDFTNYDYDNDNKNEKAIVYSGVEYDTANEALPLLVKVTWNKGTEKYNVDILEAAKPETGIVSSIKTTAAENKDNYIKVGADTYTFAKDIIANPADWTFGQKVTIYTIGGQYVNVAAADTGVESGMVEKTILVDSVKIEDGVAVISGFTADAKFEAVTMTIIGANDNGKLKARTAYLDDAAKHTDYNLDGKVDTKDTLPDFNLDGKVDDADKAFASVVLGTNKKDGVIENAFVIENNTVYTIRTTAEGNYIVAKDAATQAKFTVATPDNKVTLPDASLISIDGSYIKEGKSAQYRLAGSYKVVTVSHKEADKAYNYYSGTYTVANNAAIAAHKNISYNVLDADSAFVTKPLEQDVALIYVDLVAKSVTKTVAAFADDLTIVQILNEESKSLDYNTYNAIDIFTGEKVQVLGNLTLTDKNPNPFVTVKAGSIVVADTKWIGDHSITVTETLGKVESIVAYNSYLTGDDKDGSGATLAHKGDDANKVTFGIDNVTAWVLNDDGTLKETKAYTELIKSDDITAIKGFINGGKVVIIEVK